MLTALVLTACVIAFLWGIKTLDGKHYADPPELLAIVGSPILGLGFLFSSCWQAVVGIVVLLLVLAAMIGVASALFANSGGGQILKGLVVIGALIIALPPFWPIAIPLVICLVVGSLICAPFTLLFLAIRNFMDKGG